jgi:single-strand DNA-binding protein
MSVNNITMVGNLVDDPTLRFNDKGKATMTARIAVNEPVNRNGQWDERTTYINIVCWDRLAENTAHSATKGDRIVVTGRLQIRNWDPEPGVRQYYTELVANEIGLSTRYASYQQNSVDLIDAFPA